MAKILETTQFHDGQQDWISAVEEMARSFPPFQPIDLIVEGCIGGNEWCAYWLKQIFPNALYVGTDIAPQAVTLNSGRVDAGITQQQFQALQANQSQLTDEDGESSLVTFRANCLSAPFIESLRVFSNAKVSLLVTFNGLLALLGRDANPGERKADADLTHAEVVIGSALFKLQLHLYEREGMTLWDDRVDVTKRWFYTAENVATNLGVTTFRIKDGLVVIGKQ